jgi:hypothetical protein
VEIDPKRMDEVRKKLIEEERQHRIWGQAYWNTRGSDDPEDFVKEVERLEKEENGSAIK